MKSKSVLTALAAVTLALGPLHCLAQEASANGETSQSEKSDSAVVSYDDWLVRCYELENALPCDMFQSVSHKESQARLLSLSIAYAPEAGKSAVQITLPLGIDLRRGVNITVGDVSAMGVRPVRCELQGCMIEAILAEDMLDAMRDHATGAITLYSEGVEGTNIQFSLAGFEEAEEALKFETRARIKAD